FRICSSCSGLSRPIDFTRVDSSKTPNAASKLTMHSALMRNENARAVEATKLAARLFVHRSRARGRLGRPARHAVRSRRFGRTVAGGAAVTHRRTVAAAAIG